MQAWPNPWVFCADRAFRRISCVTSLGSWATFYVSAFSFRRISRCVCWSFFGAFGGFYFYLWWVSMSWNPWNHGSMSCRIDLRIRIFHIMSLLMTCYDLLQWSSASCIGRLYWHEMCSCCSPMRSNSAATAVLSIGRDSPWLTLVSLCLQCLAIATRFGFVR